MAPPTCINTVACASVTKVQWTQGLDENPTCLTQNKIWEANSTTCFAQRLLHLCVWWLHQYTKYIFWNTCKRTRSKGILLGEKDHLSRCGRWEEILLYFTEVDGRPDFQCIFSRIMLLHHIKTGWLLGMNKIGDTRTTSLRKRPFVSVSSVVHSSLVDSLWRGFLMTSTHDNDWW